MSRKGSQLGAPSVHIAPEHQSAPKEHWADKEVKKAAEEIREGQFRPDLSEDADILGMVAMNRSPNLEDPRSMTATKFMEKAGEMADAAALAQHPRVQECLARLEQEKSTAKTTEEQMEKYQMLHEMNARAAQKNQWDGQGRWMGKEAEEMRVVNILHWKQWLDRLGEVIGEGRVYCGRYAQYGRIRVMVPSTECNRKLVLSLDDLGPQVSKPEEYLTVATIQPMTPEWMVMRFNEYGEPTGAKYLGWRTALLCLIAKRVISEKEAHKAFPLGSGPAGEWYRQQLFELRNRDGLVN